jgi:alpha-L-fucosidase
MLNIGPRANGDVQYEISQRMLEMGEWLNVNGESIYGAEAFDLDKDMHDWGKITCRQTKGSANLYLHVFNWPLHKKLYLTGVTDKPKTIYLLSDKQKKPLPFIHSDVYTEIDLPALQPDPYVSVVVVEYNQKPEAVKGMVAKTGEGGYSLTPQNRENITANATITAKSKRGTIPMHSLINSKQTFVWKIYIDEPGEKNIDISYSFQGKVRQQQN